MFFNKKEPEKKEPVLLGEDFDIFPDLGDKRPEPKEASEPDESNELVQAEEDEPVEPTPLQKRVAEISDENWNKLQILGGIVLGALAGGSMTFLSTIPIFSTWGLLIGAVLALLVPAQLERLFDRSIKKLRVTMIFSLALLFAIYALYVFVINPGDLSAQG